MINDKISIRPTIKNIGSLENKKPEEKFQNEILRPIIKLQHELLIAFFDNYLIKKKINYTELSKLKKNELIATIFKNDMQFKTQLKGFIIGLLTIDEYKIYQNMATDINKRIIAMIKEKLLFLI